MAIYKKTFIFIIITVIFIIILNHIKSIILYHPSEASPDKYEKFNKKLISLTGSTDLVKNILVNTIDGVLLDTYYIKNTDTDKCIIIFHGNAGNVSMRFDMIKFLYNYCSVIIFDYRSFGRSANTTMLSASNLKKDAYAIWTYVTDELGIKPNNISLLGESIGCAVAIELASDLSKTFNEDNYPHSLVLNSPFYSLSSMISNIFSKIKLGYIAKVLSYMIGNEYMSGELIEYVNFNTKIVIAHSTRDEVIPYNEGLQLFNKISDNQNSKFITISGTHNNLGLTDEYIYTLAKLYN